MKKLTFENIVIIFPDDRNLERDWDRLQQYMDVYIKNHRKNSKLDVEFIGIDSEPELEK